ncbi:MAG: hypothetical protein LC803_20525 [Acidobacteria bacterium]|nr:hypothetical protein [Acidobacteriota bacterium]
MAIADESENLLDHLTERINPNGWRVISNPTRQPDLEAEELKTLLQTMQKRQQVPSVGAEQKVCSSKGSRLSIFG